MLDLKKTNKEKFTILLNIIMFKKFQTKCWGKLKQKFKHHYYCYQQLFE